MRLPTSERPFLTINQCCEALGLVKIKHGKRIYLRTMIDDAIRSGRLKSYAVSRGKRKSKHLIDPDDLKRFLLEHQFKPERRIAK